MEPHKKKAMGSESPHDLTYKTQNNNNTLRKPPYFNELSSLIAWGRKILFITICVGNESWSNAKKWQKYGDIPPLVLPDGKSPSLYQWPVGGHLVLIQAGPGPDDETLEELVKCLLTAGAKKVTLARPWAERSFIQFWAKEASC